MADKPKPPPGAITDKDKQSPQPPSVGESQDGGEGAIVARGGAKLGRRAIKDAEQTAQQRGGSPPEPPA